MDAKKQLRWVVGDLIGKVISRKDYCELDEHILRYLHNKLHSSGLMLKWRNESEIADIVRR